jgi:hypothetical protein
MLRGPSWRRLYRGIYIDAAVPLDHLVWCRAAALLLPLGGAIGLLSAASLGNVPLLGADDPVTVVVPLHSRLRSQTHLVVRKARIDPEDLTTIFDLPVTTPLRTVFDIARSLPRDDAVIALDAFFKRRKAYPDKVLDYMDTRGWWPGVVAARSHLALSDGRAESPMETRLRLLLHDAGLPAPTPQFKIFRVLRDGRSKFVARVDLAYEDWKIAIEYDGDHHRERVTHRFDMERQNELYLAGWTVLRFNADDVLRFPDKLLAVVRTALRRAGWTP